MSIKVSSLVWDKWPSGGSEMLCMLALADWCNDEGGSLYPSMATLAKKMRVSERQAQRVMRSLMNKGFISVVGNANGGAPGTTRQYHLDVEKIAQLPGAGADLSTGDIDVTPDTGVTDGCHGRRETGDTDVTQYVIDPLEEPPVKKERTRKTKANRNTALPNEIVITDTHRRLADEAGVNVSAELENFKDYHLAKGSKYVDWGRALNTWLRNAKRITRRSATVHPIADGHARPKHHNLTATTDGLERRADGTYSL